MHSFPANATLLSCHSLSCARVKHISSEHMCELLYITFPPLLVSVSLAFLLSLPWGSPSGGAAPRRGAPCVLEGPSLWGEGLFPWLCSSRSCRRGACTPPAPLGSPFSPANFLCFSVLIQKVRNTFHLQYSLWF